MTLPDPDIAWAALKAARLTLVMTPGRSGTLRLTEILRTLGGARRAMNLRRG